MNGVDALKIQNTNFSWAIVAVVFGLIGQSSAAQDVNENTVRDGKCWLGSLSFSEGASARAAEANMICNATGRWEPHSGNASVCIRDGKAFSTGSIEAVTASPGLTIKCSPDGTWEERQIDK